MSYKRYADRYDSLFDSTAFKRIAHASTRGLCCWCKRAASTELHHAQYGQGDIIGQHLFPVCSWCHDKSNPIGVHSRDNWIRDKSNPVLGNRNTPATIDQLQANYQDLCTRSSNSSNFWKPPNRQA